MATVFSIFEYHFLVEAHPFVLKYRGTTKELVAMDLKEFYVLVGGNADEMVARLGGSEDLVKRFVKKFADDKTFETLVDALSKDNVDDSFRAAHTIKGVASNLGLEHLYAKAVTVTELLRSRNIAEAKKAMPALDDEYQKTLALIRKLS
jgi:histidine phosphotransfer protein HptB